jgi:hypothetical protein
MTTPVTGGAPVEPSSMATPCCGLPPQATTLPPAGAPPVTGVVEQLTWEAAADAAEQEAAEQAQCWRCQAFCPCPCGCGWGWCWHREGHVSGEDDPHEGCRNFKEAKQ